MAEIDELMSDVFGPSPSRSSTKSAGSRGTALSAQRKTRDEKSRGESTLPVISGGQLSSPTLRSSILPSSSIETQRPRGRWSRPMSIAEKVEDKREERIRERWERHQEEWENTLSSLCKKVGRNPSELAINTQDEYRRFMEKVDLYDRAKIGVMEDINNPEMWHTTLRNNGVRYALVGSMFSGLWVEINVARQKRTRSETVRKPFNGRESRMISTHRNNSSVSSRRSKSPLLDEKLSATLTAKSLQDTKAVPVLNTIAITEADISALTICGAPLVEWAATSSPVRDDDDGGASDDDYYHSHNNNSHKSFSHSANTMKAAAFDSRVRPTIHAMYAALTAKAGTHFNTGDNSDDVEGQDHPMFGAVKKADVTRQSSIAAASWSGVLQLPAGHVHGHHEVLAVGPHAHLQVMSDATFMDANDVGAAIGSSGFLPSRMKRPQSRPSTTTTTGSSSSSASSASALPVSLKAFEGGISVAKLRLVNIGTTAFEFFWQRESIVSGSLVEPFSTIEPPGHHDFKLSVVKGELLPGKWVDILVSFTPSKCGAVRELWQASFTPAIMGNAPFTMLLRGVCLPQDDTVPRRQKLESRLRSAAAFSIARETFLDILADISLPEAPLPEEERRKQEKQLFERLNPGCHYHPDIYSRLTSVIEGIYELAEEVRYSGKKIPPARRYDMKALQELLLALNAFPETEEEAKQRQEDEERLQAEHKLRLEQEAAEKSRAEAELAAASKKGGAKSASKSPNTGRSGRPGSSQDLLEEAHEEAPQVVDIFSEYVSPAKARENRVQARKTELFGELADLAGASVEKPLEASPVWDTMRNLVLQLVDKMPLIVGGVKVALKMDMATHSVDDFAWKDTIPADEETALLRAIHGPKGRKKPKARKTRMKLGRDGQYHEVPVEDDDEDDDEDEEDEDAEIELDEVHPDDIPFVETWKMYKKRLDDAKAKQEAEMRAKALAEAAAAAEAEAAKTKGKKPAANAATAAKGGAQVSSSATLQSAGSNASIAVASEAVSAPVLSAEEMLQAECKQRLLWTAQRMFSLAVVDACTDIAKVEDERLQTAAVSQGISQSAPAVSVSQKIVMLRSDFEDVPACAFAPGSHVHDALSEMNTDVGALLAEGAKCVIIVGANGVLRPPSWAEHTQNTSQLVAEWPPLSESSPNQPAGCRGPVVRFNKLPSGVSAQPFVAGSFSTLSKEYRAFTFSTAAAHLSKLSHKPVVFLDALNPAGLRCSLYFEGSAVVRDGLASDSPLWPWFTALDYAMEEVGEGAVGIQQCSPFVRALSDAAPASPIVVMENFALSASAALYAMTSPAFSTSFQLRDVAFSSGIPILDEVPVKQWGPIQVCTWLQTLRPGVSQDVAWRKYRKTFAAEAVSGEQLLKWAALLAADAGRLPTRKARTDTANSTSSRPDVVAEPPKKGKTPAEPEKPVEIAPPVQPVVLHEVVAAFTKLGVASQHHILLESALLGLLHRHAAETAALQHTLNDDTTAQTHPLRANAQATSVQAALASACDVFMLDSVRSLRDHTLLDVGIQPIPAHLSNETQPKQHGVALGAHVRTALAAASSLYAPGQHMLCINSDIHNVLQRSKLLLASVSRFSTVAVAGVLGVAWLAHVTFRNHAAGQAWSVVSRPVEPVTPVIVRPTSPATTTPTAADKKKGAATAPAPAPAPVTKPEYTLSDELQTIFASMARLCGVSWGAAGVILQKVAAECERRGIHVIAPLDLVLSGSSFDPIMTNPVAVAAGARGEALRAAWTKPLEIGDNDDAGDDEDDDRPDEDYDSDDSDDMRALAARNERRRKKAEAEEAALQHRFAVETAISSISSKLVADVTDLDTVGWRGLAGACVALPTGRSFIIPDVEPAAMEFDAEITTRSFEIPSDLHKPADPASGVVQERDEYVIDVGSATIDAVIEAIQGVTAVVLIGTMGIVELADGATSTSELLKALAVQHKTKKLPVYLCGGALCAFARRCAGIDVSSDFSAADPKGETLVLQPRRAAAVLRTYQATSTPPESTVAS